MNEYLFETHFSGSEHEGKTYARIFKEFLVKANKNVKIPFHSHTYNNPNSTVMVYYIPEDDYDSKYDVVFERAADDMRQLGARCDIKIKPGYENNKWGDDPSHTVWVYTNPGVYGDGYRGGYRGRHGGLEFFPYRDVEVPAPYDKYFKVKKNLTTDPRSAKGYNEQIIAWLAPITPAAEEYMDIETLNGRACLTDDDEFPVRTFEKGYVTKFDRLFKVDLELLKKFED